MKPPRNPLNEKAIFSLFLKNQKLSLTRQRELILEIVFENHSHFDAEEIVATLKARHSRVSRATVYRTLSHLEQCHLIRKIDFGHGHSHYEHTLGHNHHEHLLCEVCGAVIEFNDATLEEAIGEITHQHQFSMRSHEIKIFGTCKTCSRQAN